MLWSIPVDARSHQFIPKAWLFNAWEGRRRPEAEFLRAGGITFLGYQPRVTLRGEKKLKGKKSKPHNPSPGCCTVIYKLKSEKRGQNSQVLLLFWCFEGFFLSPTLAQHRNAFGLQEHSSHQQEDKAFPSPPDSLAERRHMGFNCTQRCHSPDRDMIRAFLSRGGLTQLIRTLP